MRYVKQNPVAARMVERAEDWRWSSAASHITGPRTRDDPLTDVAALGRHVRNWRALLRRRVLSSEFWGHNTEFWGHYSSGDTIRCSSGDTIRNLQF